MNNNHIPGPWIISGRRIAADRKHGDPAELGPPTIATLDDGWSKPVVVANSRLIAASPELIDALRACLDALYVAEESCGDEAAPDNIGAAIAAARAALSKATGGTPC
jgi:hypothetical protein